ncbi:MAG TPA: hypothetical protein VG815_05100 [Chloroflexota bacterium]|jgi:hypothetical protein|nr:hypothetical protein [Chloroflexota bacterium]
MPLTPNAINHIRRTYRKEFAGRSTNVTLFFGDGTSRTVSCVWRQWDLSDPELLPQAKEPANPQQATADASFEVLTDDVDIATLQASNYVSVDAYGGEEDAAIAARYLIISVQPKGMAWPPVRAYVMLRKV